MTDFNYDLQVWVIDGFIQNCGHQHDCGCNARRWHGHTVTYALRAVEIDSLCKRIDTLENNNRWQDAETLRLTLDRLCCEHGTCDHYTCTEGQSLVEWEARR